jgi:ABC-type uncharacterized transport system substrate-binding protein
MKIMHQRFGLVTSLNRPGGNVTGVSFSSNPLNLRRLELLHELVPKTAVIGALMDANFGEAPVRELDAAAPTLGRLTPAQLTWSRMLLCTVGVCSGSPAAMAAVRPARL